MIQNSNPFGNGMGGDGPMKDGGNDFVKDPAPQKPPSQAGNDFVKNPGGFSTGSPSPTPMNPPDFVPGGGRMPFPAKPVFGGGKVPTPPFKLKG